MDMNIAIELPDDPSWQCITKKGFLALFLKKFVFFLKKAIIFVKMNTHSFFHSR